MGIPLFSFGTREMKRAFFNVPLLLEYYALRAVCAPTIWETMTIVSVCECFYIFIYVSPHLSSYTYKLLTANSRFSAETDNYIRHAWITRVMEIRASFAIDKFFFLSQSQCNDHTI